jgi:hypothetical protein
VTDILECFDKIKFDAACLLAHGLAVESGRIPCVKGDRLPAFFTHREVFPEVHRLLLFVPERHG